MSYNLETMKTLFNMEQKIKELENIINKLTTITTEQEIKYNKQSKQIEIQNVKLYKQNEQLNERLIEINEQLFLNKVNELENIVNNQNIKIDKLEIIVNDQQNNINILKIINNDQQNKIDKLETINNDQQNKIDKLETINNEQNIKINTLESRINNIIEYYDNAIEKIGHIKAESKGNNNKYFGINNHEFISTGFSCALNSKAINFESFLDYYNLRNFKYEPVEYNFNEFGIIKKTMYVNPILLLSLNIFYNLKTLVFNNGINLIPLLINAFTNDNMIECSHTIDINNITDFYHVFGYKITPLYNVSTLFLPLSSFLFWNSQLYKETYDNFFQKVFPNLKTLYIEHSRYIYHNNGLPTLTTHSYNIDAFQKTSIEYGLNYIIEHTTIEKIIISSWTFPHIVQPITIGENSKKYLQNIFNKNKTREIIFEITNNISLEEFKKLYL